MTPNVIVLFDPNEKNCIRSVLVLPEGKSLGDADADVARIQNECDESFFMLERELKALGYTDASWLTAEVADDTGLYDDEDEDFSDEEDEEDDDEQ